MNRDEALNVITVMATAWPYPEWEEGRVELWVAALVDADAQDCGLAAVAAVKSLDRAPTVAWLLNEARSEAAKREPFGPPQLAEPPASKETALAGISAARAALAAAVSCTPNPETEV